MRRRDKRARATGRLGVKKGERYALIPVELLTSEAWATLSGPASRVLIAVAAQYNGANNGRLTLPYSVAKDLGIRSKGQLIGGLNELEHRGLVEQTRQGGLPPLGCSWYALGWKAIDADESGRIVQAPASNRWASWRDTEPLNRRQPPKRNQNASPSIGPVCPDHRTTEGLHWSDHRTTEARLLVRPSDPSKTLGLGDKENSTAVTRSTGPLNVLKTLNAHQPSNTFDLADARRRVEKLHRTQPHLPPGDLAKITRLPLEAVQQILAASA